MSLNFENTEIAFRSRSNRDLNRAYWLFRLVSNPWLVKGGSLVTDWLVKLNLPIESIVRKTLFRQFCGGETIEECQRTIKDLARYNVGTILDYSVEGIDDEKHLDSIAKEIVRTIEHAENNPAIPFCVFKMTGVARFELLAKLSAKEKLTAEEKKEWGRAEHRVRALCLNAHKKNVRLFFDAEESWIQGIIDDVALEMMREFNKEKAIVYNTVQMYRVDRLAYIKETHALADKEGFYLGLKIVRGAYMEKERERATALGIPSPILPDKAATDKNYDEALKFCVGHHKRIPFCAGTHNEASTRWLAEAMTQKHIAHDDPTIFFSQLLGMSDNLTFNLAAKEFNVAKYVPYGPVKAMLPYLLRRAEENKSIAGQTSRELEQIEQELTRRKSK